MKSNLQNRRELNIFSELIESGTWFNPGCHILLCHIARTLIKYLSLHPQITSGTARQYRQLGGISMSRVGWATALSLPNITMSGDGTTVETYENICQAEVLKPGRKSSQWLCTARQSYLNPCRHSKAAVTNPIQQERE